MEASSKKKAVGHYLWECVEVESQKDLTFLTMPRDAASSLEFHTHKLEMLKLF